MDSEKPTAVTAEDKAPTPPSEAVSSIEIDPDAEARLVRKIDLHVCPVLFAMYFLCYLDRSNIGNAKIQGMTQDLGLDVGNRYNVALFVFFIPYILLEVPSNMILRKSRPSIYLASLVFCWGIINMAMGLVQTYGGLVALRFVLGVFEAGLYPGIVYYTSMYYRRHEFQKRMAGIWSANLLSGAFSGLLAYAISHLSGREGYGGWRWIFIIEGSITSATALIAVFFIADHPEQVKFLTPAERELLHLRLKQDNEKHMEDLNRHTLGLIFKDWKIWITGIINFGTITTGYSMNYFLPSILNDLGWMAADAQVHTIPVYLVAFFFLLLSAALSDYTKHRFAFIAAPMLVATTGYVMLLNGQHLSSGAKYAATFLAMFAGWGTPLLMTWMMNNLGGHWKRACGAGLANTVGSCAGLVASNVFLVREAPYYTTGYSIALAAAWILLIGSCINVTALYLENKRRDRGERDWRLDLPPEEVANLGDDNPSFRYTL